MPGQVLADNLQTTGGDQVVPRVDFPLSNWGEINAVAGGALTPHTQTGPTLTSLAMLSLVAGFTGLFEMFAKVSFSDGTTAGATTLNIVAKQGAGAGAITGGLAAAKFGSGAQSVAASAGANANGMILNVDAAGGFGLQFEGGNVTAATAVSSDAVGSLTGLLTANGVANSSSHFLGVADAAPSSAVKTPFTLGKPVAFSIMVSATAAHVITIASLNLFVRELPQA
jgi:hypothetical protein